MVSWIRCVALSLAYAASAVHAAGSADPLEAWQRLHPEIRVAPDPDFAPVDGLDASNQHVGLAADYLHLVAARSGLQFRIVPVRSWDDALNALREHRVDMLSSAFASPAREDAALFSVPYLRLPCAAFVRKGGAIQRLDQLDGQSIAVAEHHVCRETLAQTRPNANITVFASTSKALAAVMQGRAAVLVGDLVTAQAAASRSGVRDNLLVLGQIGTDDALGFAVRKDWPELKQILDRALGAIDVADETRLRQRWLKDLLPNGDAPEQAASEQLPPSNAAAIKAARLALSEAKERDPAQAQAVADLEAASTDDNQATATMAELRSLRAAAATAAADAETLEQELLSDNTTTLLAWRAALSERASVAQLETQRSNERAGLNDAQATVAQLQATVERQHERPAQIREELKLAQTELEKAREPVDLAKDTPSGLAEARKLRREATLRLLLTRVTKLEEELRSYEPRVRLESARLRQSQREVAARQYKVDALQNLILDRTRAVAVALNERLQQEATDLASANPVVRDVARQNAAYGDELVRSVAHLAEVRENHDRYARALRETAQSLKNTVERVKYSGVTEAVGLILLAERRKLQPVPVLKRKLSTLQTELAQTRIQLVDLREAADTLADPSVAVAAEVKRLPATATDAEPTLRQTLYRLFAARAEVVPQLTLVQNRLADALAETENELAGLARDTAALRDLLDERLLWTPSHAPIDRHLPMQVVSGALDTLQPGRWWDALLLAWRSALARPIESIAGIAVFIALLIVRRRVPALLEGFAQPLRRIRTDRYRLSGQSLLMTCIASLPLPVFIWMLSRVLQRAAETGYPFADALSLALGQLVAPVLSLELLRWLTTEKGLATVHFRWAPARRQALDLLRRWMRAVYLPVQFFLSLYFYYGEQLANAGLARLVFASASIVMAWLYWHTLAPGALWAQRTGQTEPVRLRQLLRLLLTATAVSLAALALLGYFLTAVMLAAHLVESSIALLGISVLNGMALRWLSLGERRLALKRMEEKRGEQPSRDDAELESRPEFAAEAEQITLASINQQTRRLLRALTIFALVAVLLWLWSDVNPALAYLGDITAWQTSYTAEGKTVAVEVTLRSILFAGVCMLLTLIATRNIPGLLEIGVLRRLDVDAPTRYAITAVARYALAIVGTILALSLLGLRWGQLQWMAAALSVGLGFGLQEIFANFVSGLIVLFERPIRVGDVITIRGIEGTVTRIRTRATTVVDWDNKEVVIPNKTFITDQLTNWTLSDAVTRVVLKLGVSYSSDPEHVRNLLLDLARAHAKVLKEPGPNCWCVALGASTLDFELRVFVADIFERNPVRNDLHGAILREFRARGIDIAFPQMDVWVRQESPIATPPEDAKPKAPVELSN